MTGTGCSRGGMEILAPAGSGESLLAALRCGAHAVYLGGKQLSARAGAANFDQQQLEEAVAACHVRGARVYLAVNTLVFDGELELAAQAVEDACQAGVDALIIQDLAVARLAREIAPGMPLHASTQMSIHSLEGVRRLEELGFSRVVLARELSFREIETIAKGTGLALECFVHGALCMCVSGQCYMSAMIGGRSGNRGQCAQPCRLPFDNGETAYALSLKDLSLVERIRELESLGVASLKIEGRLKRPEYVAAAVTACRHALEGNQPDFHALEAVFSRSGFTQGYFDGALGREMFGTRQKNNVTAAGQVLGDLASLYREEAPRVPLDLEFVMEAGRPCRLRLSDGVHRLALEGAVPQAARTAPTTEEKVRTALTKTGGTPYRVRELRIRAEGGLMLPVSALNALRRQALEELSALRCALPVREVRPAPALLFSPHCPEKPLRLRARISRADQLSPELLQGADEVVVPLDQLPSLRKELLSQAARFLVELPRFLPEEALVRKGLEEATHWGVTHVLAGNLGAVGIAREAGLVVHGDFGLNCVNTLSLEEYCALGLHDITLNPELELRRISALGGGLARGVLGYGYLPLMLTRNAPGGLPRPEGFWLTDRKGNRFYTEQGQYGAYYQVYNCVPLFLADRLEELQSSSIDFLTLYFTRESGPECLEILKRYRQGLPLEEGVPKTRGLFYRQVL